MPGWSDTTAGAREMSQLPDNARASLERMQELLGVDLDIVSTSAERDDTIVEKHPFD